MQGPRDSSHSFDPSYPRHHPAGLEASFLYISGLADAVGLFSQQAGANPYLQKVCRGEQCGDCSCLASSRVGDCVPILIVHLPSVVLHHFQAKHRDHCSLAVLSLYIWFNASVLSFSNASRRRPVKWLMTFLRLTFSMASGVAGLM